MDADKIKDFLVYNFEKGIVVIVMVMAGFLVYSGLGKPIITQEEDPDDLAQRATEVKRKVDDDHTAAIINIEDPEESREPTFNIAEAQQKFRNPIKPSMYQIGVFRHFQTEQGKATPPGSRPRQTSRHRDDRRHCIDGIPVIRRTLCPHGS